MLDTWTCGCLLSINPTPNSHTKYTLILFRTRTKKNDDKSHLRWNNPLVWLYSTIKGNMLHKWRTGPCKYTLQDGFIKERLPLLWSVLSNTCQERWGQIEHSEIWFIKSLYMTSLAVVANGCQSDHKARALLIKEECQNSPLANGRS